MTLDEALESMFQECRDYLYQNKPLRYKSSLTRLSSYKTKYKLKQLRLETYITKLNSIHPHAKIEIESRYTIHYDYGERVEIEV